MPLARTEKSPNIRGMSWNPSEDPILGDKRSCDALELVIIPRARDLGDFEVRRALPHGKRQMVGPFIFFDQFGPVQFIAGAGMDVRPHPHIGLATVTYLFDGRIMHRDSEGNALEITPGAMNLMTAGSGIAHSERTPGDARNGGMKMSGIQSWIALPKSHEEVAPTFQNFTAESLPIIEDGIVPSEKFKEYLENVYAMFNRYNLQAAIWGHAGNANLHMQPFLDLSQVGDRQKVFKIIEDYYSMVIGLGGSTSGEHSDGRLRAPYLKTLYGDEIYELFQKIKKFFDPYGILNPGVKINVTLDDIKPLLRHEYSMEHLYDHMPRS